MVSNANLLSNNQTLVRDLANLYLRQLMGEDTTDLRDGIEDCERKFERVFAKDAKRWMAASMNVALGHPYDIGFKKEGV